MLARAATVLVGATLTCCLVPSWQPAKAADFSKAKKVFVPPTRIPRRFDSEAQEDGYASTTDSSGYNPAFGTPESPLKAPPPSKNKPSKYGLIPPPPPLTPSLLPASLMHAQVPAPPPMTPLAASAQKGQWSTTVQRTLKSASTNPKVASFLDQAQAKAQQLVKEGKVAQAQDLLQSYVKNLPRDKALQTDLANVTVQHAKQLMASQDFQAAAKNLRSALALQPGSASAQSMLDQVFKKQGMNAENPGDRLQEAAALAKEGRNSEAEFEYKAAVKLNPSIADGHVGLGDLELKAGNKEKASLEYQQALEAEPHSAAALRQMGLLRLAQNDLPGANSNLSRALVVNPKDQVAGSHLIDLWQKQVAHNTNEVNGHLGLARAYQLSGDLQSAQTEYRKVVQIDPNNANLPMARQSFKLALARQEAVKSMDAARTLAGSGAVQEAYQKTTEAVALSPGDTSIRMFQGQLAEKLGLSNEAHSIYMNVLHDDPTNMTAAQRLNALANPASAQAVGQAAMANLLPGLTPPMAPTFNRQPGSIFTTQEAPPAATLPGIPLPARPAQQAQEAPPAATLPGIPKPALPAQSATPQVNAMSNFLTSMRTFHYQQKAAIEQAEEESKANINASIGASTKPSPMAGAAADPDSIGSGPNDAPMLNAAGSNLADVQKLLKSIGAKNSPNLGAATPNPSGASASAATAGTGSLSSGKDAEFAALAKKYGLPYSSGSARTPAATSAAGSAAPSSGVNDAISQRLGNLEAQNRQLQSQLAAAQQRLNSMQQPGGAVPESLPALPSVPSNMALPASNGGIPASYLPGYPANLASLSALTQGAGASAPSNAGFLALAGAPAAMSAFSDLSPQAQGQVQAMLRDRIATQPTNGYVRFELEGVKPSALDIKLNVVLHNDQGVPLSIPPTVKAIIRMNGQPQRTVKLTFPANTVAANGEVHGFIKVPGHNLSPAADVFIPNLLPATATELDRNVHLTVPISYLK